MKKGILKRWKVNNIEKNSSELCNNGNSHTIVDRSTTMEIWIGQNLYGMKVDFYLFIYDIMNVCVRNYPTSSPGTGCPDGTPE